MKKFGLMLILAGALLLAACGEPEPVIVEARAIFDIDRVYIDELFVPISDTNYENSRLTFIGPQNGGNIFMNIGGAVVHATINPSASHPSFEAGYWHHHLYASHTSPNSPRINFLELLPHLEIDDNGADDNTQSAYQRGNLHYIVATGEFRLRFTINGATHDLIFTEIHND